MSDDGSAVVNVLGCERSEPGFESRRPESDFTSTHQKTEEEISSTLAARHLQPLVTITLDEAQLLELLRPSNIYITHNIPHLTRIPDRIQVAGGASRGPIPE